jgi:hypothetical protein
MRNFSWLSLVVILFVGCGKSVPELQGFDRDTFKNDRNGCKGNRVASEQILKREKENLLALTEMQIVKTLGRPDQNEIYKRNQKFFTYFLEPSPNCTGDSAKASKKLTVRFNAMGLAKEIVID